VTSSPLAEVGRAARHAPTPETSMPNPIRDVQKFGQSIWYDNIRRGLITSGELKSMIDADGCLGVTSNPAIFEKALAGSADYDPAFKALVSKGVKDAQGLFENLAIQDIQLAADVLHPTYLTTDGVDGYVSLEVSPYLAFDTDATIADARRLWAEVARDNVMIKVPATPEGIPAIRTLIGEGINVNVTLIFAVSAYEAVADAYVAGLEHLVARGGDPKRVASVASFFVSRIDALIDDRLSQELDATADPERRKKLKSLMGQVAIANAKIAYARFMEIFSGARWEALASRGARVQRVLWASTGTKNPKYPKTLYVDELIGPHTVNTVPAETYVAFKQEGRVRDAITENFPQGLAHAQEVFRTLSEVGISMQEVTDQLLEQGARLFSDAFDRLLGAVEKKRQALLSGGLTRQAYALGPCTDAVAKTLEAWRAAGNVRRLWARDASLWTNQDEDQWLGWLHVVDGWRAEMHELVRVAETVRGAEYLHAVVLGMGGSSLCPDVMRKTFGRKDGFPELLVLDSTVPAQVRTLEQTIDIERTLFIVSSKSGGTIEPNVFKQYFFDKVERALGKGHAGSRFIAITDPNTKMHEAAKADGFGHIAFGVPSIGGRFSALSNFGLMPSAIAGIDVRELIESTEIMVQACGSVVPPEQNLGVRLGAILGTLALQGRDKLTLIASPSLRSLGAWIEQLIAESTGKEGKGIVPVDDESLGRPNVYGSDRLFVYVRQNGATCADQEAAIAALEAAGQPIVRITLADSMDLGEEFFRWEMATAVAGAILGINTFDQPDVEAAKIAARKLMAAFESSGKLPDESPVHEERGLRLFADARNAADLSAQGQALVQTLARHLGRLGAGDYFAINAYVEMNDANHAALSAIRHAVRDAKKVATTLGYGPRFLHSTGQLHKGGPNTGVFLQITCDDAEDVAIPGQRFSFGVLKAAQAQGDFEVLAERGRRLLRVHLGSDVPAGLATLREAITQALGA
jgi:transaldolase/glucose-6-phosphate isomerase